MPARSVAAVCALAVALATCPGCERAAPSGRYSVVLGDVLATDVTIGEITVRLVRRGAHESAGESLHCTVTRDSEIYIDDRFSSLADVRAGDRVELIGYRDPDPAINRFIVTNARIERTPESAMPDALPRASAQESPAWPEIP